MTTHLKHLPSWRSSSLSGDEDAMVVIQQFTDGDDQDAQEVMDAIKQFAEEDDFQDDLNDTSSSPSSNYSETNYPLKQEWEEICPRVEDFRPYVQNGFYGTLRIAGSPPEHGASATLLQECSIIPTSTITSCPPPTYYRHCGPAYPTSPLPPSPDNSASSCGSRCSLSPDPHTPTTADANPYEPYAPTCHPHLQDYVPGMVMMGSYHVCMDYLPQYGDQAVKAFPMYATSCSQVESPSLVVDDSAQERSSVDIFTQANGLQFYKDTKAAVDVVPPFLVGAGNESEDNAQVKSKKLLKPKVRKVKPQVDVDTGGIKDIATSSQLWEFTLKILEKPTYSYMVSWENKKEGVFRFHNAQAFATLWGRHRNRPNMTYDKVARALRYYYKRDILNQVGGRLTYKFSKRLQKMFSED